MTILTQGHGLPVQRACPSARLSRTAFYRAPQVDAAQTDADAPVIEALEAVVTQHGRWGIWKCLARLRALGNPWNHKRVYTCIAHSSSIRCVGPRSGCPNAWSCPCRHRQS